MKSSEVKRVVKDEYKNIAVGNKGCCACGAKNIAKSIGYSEADLKITGSANMGLGCGNPVAFSKIKEGDTVLDLGSGGGIDCILAAQKVGPTGKVVGVDMTKEMIEKAQRIATEQNVTNVKFVLGEIENLPLKDNSVDIIISNCVVNLTPDKTKAFKEARRVLKTGGKMYISDIVLLGELSEEQKSDKNLLSGCVAGALQKEDYISKMRNIGFKLTILNENKDVSKQQYKGIALESLMVELTK